MAYFGGIFFANMGGGGGRNYVQKESGGWGGRGREKVGREGLWLEGLESSSCRGRMGGTFQSAVGAGPTSVRRARSTPDPDTSEKYRDTPPISIAILWQKYRPLFGRK